MSAGCSLPEDPQYITASRDYHIVKPGDTLFSISREHSLSVDKLKLYNNLSDERIIVGQKIYLIPPRPVGYDYITRREIPGSKYHRVERGETLFRISRMYGIDQLDLMEYNRLASYEIKTDQRLWLEPGHVDTLATATPVKSLPPRKEIERKPAAPKTDIPEFHIVKNNETLFSISRQYGISVLDIKDLNHLTDAKIKPGQKLRIKAAPGTQPQEKRIQPVSEPKIVEAPREEPEFSKPRGIIVPVEGKLISPFGMRHKQMHKGIDIGAPQGTPILAALDGKVVFSGIQRGYGNVLIIEHENSVMTVYAHNEANLVRQGDDVAQGQPIATVGRTGNASTSHCHFEYRVRGKAIDPMKVLPAFD